MLTVLPIGTPVLVGPDDEPIPGRIEAVTLRGTTERPHVLYEVAWWDGRSRNEETLERWQFAVAGDDAETTAIGFGREG
jgi:hypothetical protein